MKGVIEKVLFNLSQFKNKIDFQHEIQYLLNVTNFNQVFHLVQVSYSASYLLLQRFQHIQKN